MTDESDLQREVAILRRRLAQLETAPAPSSDAVMLQVAEELAQLGALVWDAERATATASDGLLRILGVPLAQLLTIEAALELVHPDDRKRIGRMARLALRGTDIQPTGFRVLRTDGTVVEVVGQVRATLDESGRLRCLRCALMDVTAQRELANQHLQAQKLEAIGTLAGGVAHDFSDFLQAIEGQMDLMRLEPQLSSKALHAIDEVGAALDHCRQLTRRLLTFGRKHEPAPQLHDVRALIGTTARMLSRLLSDNVEMTIAIDPEPCLVRIDAVQFEQVLVNLAINARDAMPEGGTLDMRIERLQVGSELSKALGIGPGPYCRLKVTDSGHGMTEGVKGRIFEPFFTTKAQGSGTGLGLSTVYSIVRDGGGMIGVESRPGVGTCFTIYFPTSDSEQVAAPSIEAPATLSTGTETVLLVEDGEDLRSVTRQQLERAGYRVLSAPDGAAALQRAVNFVEPIQLLLTDVMMPRMSGPELAGHLQKLYPRMAVIFMSGYTERLVLRRAALRCDRVSLHKPFSMQELLQCVREQLDRAHAAAPRASD